jgi:purine nucleosidase
MESLSELYSFPVPEPKRIRLIIDSDAKNEADDQYAIVHALLTPKFILRGMIGAHFGEEKSAASMDDSYNEIKRVAALMGIGDSVPILHGAPHALRNRRADASEGSALILREAERDDPRPLFCAFLGPLTDMAAALAERPGIAQRVTVVWIGGGAWPEGGWEYNLLNDIEAANVVLESEAPFWQIPRNVYSRMKVSLAELQARVKPCGAIGGYLFDQLVETNERYGDNPEWPPGESWVLGDSAAIGVLLDEHAEGCVRRSAPAIDKDMRYVHDPRNRKIRVYRRVDARFILEDFYSKLALYARKTETREP